MIERRGCETGVDVAEYDRRFPQERCGGDGAPPPQRLLSETQGRHSSHERDVAIQSLPVADPGDRIGGRQRTGPLVRDGQPGSQLSEPVGQIGNNCPHDGERLFGE